MAQNWKCVNFTSMKRKKKLTIGFHRNSLYAENMRILQQIPTFDVKLYRSQKTFGNNFHHSLNNKKKWLLTSETTDVQNA